MPTQTSSRPARRAATQRLAIVASDSEADSDASVHLDDSMSASKSSPPRQRLQRRIPKPTEANETLNTHSHETDNQENTAPEHDMHEHATATKRPIARRSVRASRRSLAPSSSVNHTPIPEDVHVTSLPERPNMATMPSAVSESSDSLADKNNHDEEQTVQEPLKIDEPDHDMRPGSSQGSALQDITQEAVNQPTQPDVSPGDDTVTKTLSTPAVLERPMDIVIRARAKPQPSAQESLPATRTVITYLILNNFKSYAGRQEVGPFHASFSSVVGPNGSGKSNVIDSLLFVFGFRASKMRQGKISSLIHNSAAHPDLDHCEVEVHFQEVKDLPDGQKEIVPDSNLVISRKAFKNNSSNYYMNGKLSNFTAVTTLLKERGVDLDHKRFLILQGEVESIAQMKPKAANEHDDGLLEYLEDIIGTSKYKAPIEEAAQETDMLNEVCVEKQARVQHVEKEKKSLETRKNAALAYIRDENALAIKQSALCQIFVHECESNIEVTEEAVQEIQSQLDEELERHKGSEQSIIDHEQQLRAETGAFEELELSSQKILKQLAKLDKESVKYDEKRKHLTAKSKKLEKAATSGRSGISEATAYLRRLADDLSRNASSATEIEQRLQSEETHLEKIRAGLQGKTQGFSDKISERQKLLEPWIEQINKKRSAIAVAISELAILRERDEAGSQAMAEMQTRIERLQKDRAEKLRAIKEFTTSKREQESELQSIQATIKKLSQEEPSAKAKLSSARQKAEEAKSSLVQSRTQGNVLAGLSRLRESGRISGFHGRLGNLGTIDSKFDVAVSTACPALDNLVVDTVEVGQRCIEYLRKNNLGRANFICLDKLATRDLGRMQTPENATRLFDLVKSQDEKFRPAFYSVMQNTLVATDLVQANRIAYGAQRWRVVTLDGQLIDKSGTMSGGGTRIAKGAMSSKLVRQTTSEQVVALEAEQEAEERLVADLQKEIERQQSALRRVQEEIPALDTKLQRLQLEVDSLDRNLADCQRRTEELANEKQPDKSNNTRRTALERVIAGLEDEILGVQKNTTSIEVEIKELQDKIMEVGGVQLRLQKAKVDGLREELDTLGEEMSVAETNQAKTQKQLEKHTKAMEAAESELATSGAELARLEDEAQEQSDSASGIRQEAEVAQEALENKKEELATLRAELERKTAELNETRGIEIEMRNKLEESQKTVAENHKRLKYWQDKLGKLTVQNVDDVGVPADMAEDQQLITYTLDELADLDKDMLKGEIAVLEEKTQSGNADATVIPEYRRRVEELAARSGDLAEAVNQRDAAKRRCEELRRLRLEGFMEGFSIISLRLKEMYQMITMGGNAELELVDSLDPFSEGILFSVMPPKKSWKNISNLSGGEKTLSSLALVFALHHYKPTPLYVMDEIDAALDFRNVSIVASYIKERTKNAQFIVISLRNNMFELAARLVGVYKVNQMTKSVTVENRDYIARA